MNAAVAEQTAHLDEVGLSGRRIIVHKKDHEGILEIDALTGQVLPNQHDRPSWAEGLYIAQLTERVLWWTARLGQKVFEESSLGNPETLAFEDLGWLGIDTTVADGDQNELHIPADDEFRMDLLAQFVGVDRDTDAVAEATTEVEIAMDTERTEAEMKDFREAQEAGYKAVNE